MYEESRIQIRASDGTSIPATYAFSGADPRKCILLLHGISTNKDEYLGFFETLSRELVARGIFTLRIDFRGHGESDAPPSDFTIPSQIIDASAAVAWLHDEKGYDKVDLLGCSFGAPPCLFVSHMLPGRVGSIFLVAPVLDYIRTFIEPQTEWALEVFEDVVRRTIEAGEKVYLNDSFYVAAPLVAEMLTTDVERFIAAGPIHVVHGDEDNMVPFAITADLAARHDNMDLHVMKHTEHGFTESGDEDGSSPTTRRNIDTIVAIVDRYSNGD